MLYMEGRGMCSHGGFQIIEEGMVQEKWEEGDLFVQEVFDWVYCPECNEDFACNRR